MSIFSRIFGSSKDEYSEKYRRKMGEHLDKKAVKYVTERDENGCELVLGKEGCIYLSGDLLRVVTTPGKIFEGRLLDLLMSELMSGEGVIIEGQDLITGRERKIVCYYTYYCKPVLSK